MTSILFTNVQQLINQVQELRMTHNTLTEILPIFCQDIAKKLTDNIIKDESIKLIR